MTFRWSRVIKTREVGERELAMTLRLNSYRFYIRLWTYLLPLAAFSAAAYVRFGLLRRSFGTEGL